MGNIWQKEPAVIIGAAATVLLQLIGALVDQGFVSEVAGGRITDLVNAGSAFLVATLPLLLALVIRAKVYSPATVQRLGEGE